MKQKITKYTFSISTVALAVASTSAIASVDFHGYMRAGIGQNVDGGGQLCYGNGGGDMHRVGRLGDECDMYAELSLGKTVYEKDGKRFKVVSTVALGTHEDLSDTRGNSWQGNGGSAANPWEGGRASVREMYGAMSGVIGDSTIKMGKFFGQRKDVHIQDFYYLMNSGYGVSMESLSVGPGKLSLSWIQAAQGGTDDVGASFGAGEGYIRTNKLDARYLLPFGESQSVEFIGIYGSPTLTQAQKDAVIESGDYAGQKKYDDASGYLLMVEHTIGFAGGFNKAVVQYATNGFAEGASVGNFGGLNYGSWGMGYTPGDDDTDPSVTRFDGNKGFRLLDHGVAKLGGNVEVGYVAWYGELDPAQGDKQKEYSLTIRPMYHWNEYMSTVAEIGYSSKKTAGETQCGSSENFAANKSCDLSKVTLAQQWSPVDDGGFWARPSFRLFVSHYAGERAIDKADTMFGAQVEAWW